VRGRDRNTEGENATDRHTEAPQSAKQRGQVLPILLEIGPSVECVEWNIVKDPERDLGGMEI
jgi:hypothetical protein